MKINFIKFLVIIFLLGSLSCKKESADTLNSFSYSGNECTISKAYLFSGGKHPVYTDSFFYNLILVSPTISVAVDSSNSFILSGKGDYLNIELLYADSLGLQLGEYFTYPENNRKILGLNGGVDFDTDISVGLKIIIKEDNYGEMTIGETNGENSFEFKMISAAEKQLTGNFKGTIENLN